MTCKNDKKKGSSATEKWAKSWTSRLRILCRRCGRCVCDGKCHFLPQGGTPSNSLTPALPHPPHVGARLPAPHPALPRCSSISSGSPLGGWPASQPGIPAPTPRFTALTFSCKTGGLKSCFKNRNYGFLRIWGGWRVSCDKVREWHGHIYTTKRKIDS